MPNGRCSVCGRSAEHETWCARITAYLTERYRLEDRLCDVDGCDEKHAAKGLCRHHYSAAAWQERKAKAKEAACA